MKLGAWGGDQVVCERREVCGDRRENKHERFHNHSAQSPNIRTGKKDIWRLSLTSFVLSFISSFPLVLRL